MRIIAGTFRSRQLKSLKGLALRPTSDMLRETLFNILGPRVEGSRFLDLFAGTGAVRIEAISRGAVSAVFVENHAAAVRLIRENLASLEIKSAARIVASAAAPALTKLQSERAAAFDFIFLDPPYANKEEYEATLRYLENSSLIAEYTIVIAEHHKSFELPASLSQFERVRTLRQGDAALTFYRRSPEKSH
ncbi:MAG TPA: 16S rRNA (guanine(966)-N(2))-methyltransferase RsmD [Candidatus Bathyarchaeia archaeon]|nr:16S rRNA (guanine(966)-N(2))-methyltransferase RsmD [Candidatus Bathyarchaeia archaeon]